MTRIRFSGQRSISAPRWIAVWVPVMSALVGALLGILSMLLVAVTESELEAARQGSQRIADDRWTMHQGSHRQLDDRLGRMEAKLDRLLERN